MNLSSAPTDSSKQSSRHLFEHSQPNGKSLELYELENQLKDSLESCKIKDVRQLPERIKRIEIRIQQYLDEGRNSDTDQERRYLNELKQLLVLSEAVSFQSAAFLSKHLDKVALSELVNRLRYGLEKCKIEEMTQIIVRIRRTEKRIELYEEEDRTEEAQHEMRYLRELQLLQRISEEIFLRKSNKSSSKTNFCEDVGEIPRCAEKTIVELLSYFRQRLIGEEIVENTADSVTARLELLHDQLVQEGLFSDQINAYLQDLTRTVRNDDYSSTVLLVGEILRKIRPLNVREIRRLIGRAEHAARLISNQDIVLLVGVTGSGKSTTVQFLTGAKMKNTRVEIVPGKFLEHVSIDSPITNPTLAGVITSPLSKSTTQFLLPITVQLKDLLADYETGEIILCDAPDFDDTSGPEVDIANAVGVLQALKTCKSVKILALSSCRSLDDERNGIETLIRVLIKMISGIEDRLDGVLYGFTKYPSQTDIHALLVELKASRVNQNPLLRTDNTFLTVLTDMIKKAEKTVEKVNPIDDDPKNLIKKLRSLNGICYPGEVFRFSTNEETKAKIEQQIHRYAMSITSALKQKDIALVTYHLDNFKMLSEWIKQDFVQDAYADSIRALSDHVGQYCGNVTERLTRLLASQDRLTEEDVKEFTTAHHYLQQLQNLRGHLGSNLAPVELFTDHMLSQLEKRNLVLHEEVLYNPSIGTYLDNLHLLRQPFPRLDSAYRKMCEQFDQRLELVFGASIPELISANEFQRVAEIMLQIASYIPFLNHHLNGKVETKLQGTIRSVLQYLEDISEKINALFSRMTLNQSDIEVLRQDLFILRSAKETTALHGQIWKNRDIKDLLDDIYHECIMKVIKYTDEISIRIKDRLEKTKHLALETVEQFVRQLELIRTIPEIESKTTRTFYQLMDNVHGSMQQLQRDTEDMLHTEGFQTGAVSIRPLARSLGYLKRTQWIDRIYPGASDTMIRPIRDELVDHAGELEQRLIKLNLSIKFPQHIRLGQEILERIELIGTLKSSIPELQSYQDRITQSFLKKTQAVFEQIKKLFSLADNTIAPVKQEVIDLERTKVEYDHLYPHLLHLRQSGYSSITKLNDDIEQLKMRHNTELEEQALQKRRLKSKLKGLQSIISDCEQLTSPKAAGHLIGRLLSRITSGYQRSEGQSNEYLRERGYSSIGIVQETIAELQEDLNQVVKLIELKQIDFNRCLIHLESIRGKYLYLFASHDSSTPQEIDFLHKKGQSSYESLEISIDDKKSLAIQYETQKQLYYFSEKVDAVTANNALMYINHCEAVTVQCSFQDIALKAKDVLEKYLREYASFVDREIERNFKQITQSDRVDLYSYSAELERLFHELSSLEKYSLVFECFQGAEKIEYWHRQFRHYYWFLDHRLDEFRVSARNHELQHLIVIAETLSCLDHVAINGLPENRFHNLYRQYRSEMTKMSEEVSQSVIDYISKGDYVGANLRLAEILENSSHSKSITQIKYHLNCSLHTLMKQAKADVHLLGGKIEREDNHRHQLREIIENTDKLRLVRHQSHLVALIDGQTKTDLSHFDEKIKRLLSQTFLNGIHSIELFIDLNSFLEAEKCMENLHRGWCQLPDDYTSASAHEKIVVIKQRLNSLPADTDKRYDFVDIDNLPNDSPKDLLEQLKRAVSGGYFRYHQLFISLRERLRLHFDHAINQVQHHPLNDRSAKIRTLKYAFYFLPDDLKLFFQSRIDELSHSNTSTKSVLEFD